MSIAVVAGNLKPASRTLDAGVRAARLLVGHEPDVVIDVITLGAGLLAFNDEAVIEAIAAVRRSTVALFCSPTYKASITGVLKLFLDLIPTNGLSGTIAIPLMLGAGPGHALAAELALRPVLLELGAICPTRGLYLLEGSYAEEGAMDSWLAAAVPSVAALLQADLKGEPAAGGRTAL